MSTDASIKSPLSRRGMALAIVIGLHLLILYGLATGLARKVVQVIAPPIEVEMREEINDPEPPPPPPPPEFERPPVQVPLPDISIEIPPEPQTTAIAAVVTPTPAPPAPPPVVAPGPPVSRTAAKFDARRSPSTDEYYPPTSRRLGEEGGTVVDVCITPEGRVSGRPKVSKRSGFNRLDEAAVDYASRTRWIPATENGRPVEYCTSLLVRFVLTR